LRAARRWITLLPLVNDFLQRIRQSILDRRMIPDAAPAVVAVSGGVDSMVLLRVLAELASTHRWPLTVAHFNHQLRGAAADADERFVARAAQKLGLRFVSERGDVKALAAARKISVEMAARELRHRFLAQTAKNLGARHIFLAHHADDQVELFFLRLLRGAGTQGLGGMEWSAPSPVLGRIALLRPLLGETKAALLEFARAERISFREDATNASPGILRNRIRHKLLPLLRRDFAPAPDRAVLRSMELIHDEGEFVTRQALAWLNAKRRPAFDTLHVALQRRVTQIGLLAHGVVPQFEHVEHLRACAGEWLTVATGVEVRRQLAGQIETRPAEAPAFRDGETLVELSPRSGHITCDSVALTWKVRRGHRRPSPRPGVEFLDADAVGGKIILRHWCAGDRFQPLGMARSVKLQDFFTNAKIPRTRRHELLLATTVGGEIFWVEGARIGERFKVTTATRRVLRWSWRRA
jgi:tRNA(Ile)-lysidine synthase